VKPDLPRAAATTGVAVEADPRRSLSDSGGAVLGIPPPPAPRGVVVPWAMLVLGFVTTLAVGAAAGLAVAPTDSAHADCAPCSEAAAPKECVESPGSPAPSTPPVASVAPDATATPTSSAAAGATSATPKASAKPVAAATGTAKAVLTGKLQPTAPTATSVPTAPATATATTTTTATATPTASSPPKPPAPAPDPLPPL
jgi:hypothetical protein